MPPGGGILLSLAVMVPFWLCFGACAWQPRTIKYPSGLAIVQVDANTIDKVCPVGLTDGGRVLDRVDGERVVGCYAKWSDTIYVLNDCEGAKSLTHELAHRENIADPERAGFNW